ncbi:hypothetical protein V6N13_116631 [Hibiscus sabdariffa]
MLRVELPSAINDGRISGTWGAEVLGFVVRSCSSLTRQRMAGEVWQKSHAVRQSSWVLLSNCNKFLDIVPSSNASFPRVSECQVLQQSHTNFGLASSPSWTVCEGFKRLVPRAMIEHCTIFNKHACHERVELHSIALQPKKNSKTSKPSSPTTMAALRKNQEPNYCGCRSPCEGCFLHFSRENCRAT